MNVLVTGGTGFIGSALCTQLLAEEHHVTVMTRDHRKAHMRLKREVIAVEDLRELSAPPEAIVNLAGQSLGSGRWTEQLKQTFVASRVGTTERIIRYLRACDAKPKVLISGSAVGFYGARGDEALVESDSPGQEFQSDLCRAWEEAALKAEADGVRVCLLRTGVVLGKAGGALSSLLPSFRVGLGGYLGDGRQWMSWIHIKDLIGVILHLMEHETLTGPFNATAPNPETNRTFARKLGLALNRPVFMRIPAWVVRIRVGEMARLFVTGQKVIPARLLESGYEFAFPELGKAFTDIVG